MRRGSKSVFGGTMGNGVLMELVYLLLELLAISGPHRRKWPGSSACFFARKKMPQAHLTLDKICGWCDIILLTVC